MSLIHPTAVIDPSAQIDPTVEIAPYAVIGQDVIIGAGCKIGAHATVERVHMGKENRLHPGCFVGTPPQDIKYAGEPTRLIMGDKNTVRECVTLNRGTVATGETRIGNGCLFMAYSHVAHDCRVGNGVILVNSVPLAGHVSVGDFSVLGGSSAVHQFVRIGRLVMLSGGSMVGKDIPPFCTAQGDRAVLRGLNSIGLRRAGVSRQAISAIKDAYKTLFMSRMRLEEAVASLRASSPCAEVLEMLDFVAASKRGVTRPAAGATAEEEAAV